MFLRWVQETFSKVYNIVLPIIALLDVHLDVDRLGFDSLVNSNQTTLNFFGIYNFSADIW